MARPRTLPDDVFKKCFIRMHEGITLKQACIEQDIDYSNTLDRINKSTELADLYARAREQFAHTCVQKMFEIADTEMDVQRARLKCDNIKWYAARVIPKSYGDKTETTVKGDAKAPLIMISTGVNPYADKA